MKKNNKGFMITEALIISTIVLAILVFMYAQFRTINKGFNQTFKYNTVEDIYKTNEIKKFIETDATNNMISLLNSSDYGYLDITECNITTYNDVSFCKYLYEKLQIKSVLLLAEDVTNVVNGKMNNLETGTQNFLKYIKNNYTGNYHRIVVSYKDGTYATLRIDVLRDIYDFEYTGDVQIFTAPIDAYYQIELWGAQGGDASDTYIGGKGAYTKGTIYLKKDTKLYVYVGATGNRDLKFISDTITDTATNYTWPRKYYEGDVMFNSGTYSSAQENGYGMSGGGATDIRLINGNWDNFDSLKSRIMVASGGSGASTYHRSSNGVPGGALSGIDGSVLGTDGSIPTGGTQTSGGLKGTGRYTTASTNGTFGKGGQGVFGTSSGGAGYYGGGAASHGAGTVGIGGSGSSFISGYEGCDAIAETSTESNIIHTGQSVHYSGYEFEYAEMIAGNSEMPNYQGGTMIGNSGNGYARITMLSE